MNFEMHALIYWSGDTSVSIPGYSLEWPLGLDEGDMHPDDRESIRVNIKNINSLLSGEDPLVFFSDECWGCGKEMINHVCEICREE